MSRAAMVVRVALGLTVLALLWLAVRRLDWARLVEDLARTPIAATLVLSAAALLATALQGWRFHLLLPAGFTAWEHVWLSFALHAGNILLPFRGGELLRPYYMWRRDRGLTVATLAGFSLVDKAIEVLCFVPFVLGACHVFATDERFARLQRVAWPIGAVAGVALTALCVVQLRRRGARAALGPLGLSLVMWGLNWVMFYCVVPDARLSLAILVGVNAALVIPGLPGQVGTYEAGFVGVGLLGGWPMDRLLAAALVSHVVQIAVTLAVGVPLMVRFGVPQGEVAQAIARDQAS